MSIKVGEPDHKGNRKVVINAGGTGPLQLSFGDGAQPVIAFLERVRAALPRPDRNHSGRRANELGRASPVAGLPLLLLARSGSPTCPDPSAALHGKRQSGMRG